MGKLGLFLMALVEVVLVCECVCVEPMGEDCSFLFFFSNTTTVDP